MIDSSLFGAEHSSLSLQRCGLRVSQKRSPRLSVTLRVNLKLLIATNTTYNERSGNGKSVITNVVTADRHIPLAPTLLVVSFNLFSLDAANELNPAIYNLPHRLAYSPNHKKPASPSGKPQFLPFYLLISLHTHS